MRVDSKPYRGVELSGAGAGDARPTATCADLEFAFAITDSESGSPDKFAFFVELLNTIVVRIADPRIAFCVHCDACRSVEWHITGAFSTNGFLIFAFFVEYLDTIVVWVQWIVPVCDPQVPVRIDCNTIRIRKLAAFRPFRSKLTRERRGPRFEYAASTLLRELSRCSLTYVLKQIFGDPL